MSSLTISGPGLSWINESPGPDWFWHESGRYSYESAPSADADFTPTSVVEQYCRWKNPEAGQTRIRASRDALATPASLELRVETLSKGLLPVQMEFQSLDAGANTLNRVQYEFEEGMLHWKSAKSDGSWQAAKTLAIPGDPIPLPLMRNYLGEVLTRTTQREQAPVIVPELTDPRQPSVFTPTVETRRARLTAESNKAIIAAGRTWDCEAYSFIGGPYDEASSFWVCKESQRLIHYVFQAPNGERWSTKLVALDSSEA